MQKTKEAPPPSAEVPAEQARFDPNQTLSYQIKMKNKAPVWFASMLAGTYREKVRVRDEITRLKGAVPLLMKQRNGGKWTPMERKELVNVLRSASAVSPYLLIWAVPGSMLMLPLLAWHLDTRRKNRVKKAAP
jgi:hypothetical protein